MLEITIIDNRDNYLERLDAFYEFVSSYSGLSLKIHGRNGLIKAEQLRKTCTQLEYYKGIEKIQVDGLVDALYDMLLLSRPYDEYQLAFDLLLKIKGEPNPSIKTHGKRNLKL